ncbi:MAG TPA: hypothetical protein VFB43_20305 [Terracidiphilus sp.]|jgi:hypothetical protein|nr:hypothetical protein [Terracidiphilus sp.]
MSDAKTREQGTSAESAIPEGEPVSRYEVVPSAKADEADLYSFRAEMPPPPAPAPPPTPAQQMATARKNIAMGAGVAAICALLLVLIAVLIQKKQEAAPPFIDLGENNVAASGLGGRLLAKWDGEAGYELHLDPLAPAQVPAFSAVASNPPGPISIDFRLKNGFGTVVCQKQVLVPIDPAGQADPQQTQPLVPTKTIGGDVVQNVTGADGQINEIVINGQLPCSVQAYKSLASWEFSSSFPTVAEQEDWMRHEQGVEADLRHKAAEARAKALIPRVRPIPSPIEGDDVIVSDNPSKGTVETRDGRVFYIGRTGLRGRMPGWQVFPASIHFRCDTKATCTLTRHDASGSLQARLLH